MLSETEIINKDYFVTGDVVELYGTVNGDVYAAGGTVLVDGFINGDLIVAAGTVTISGEVLHNVRVAGGQVTFTGDIGRNVTAVGGNLEFTDSATIGGSLTTAGGNVNVNSPIGKGVTAGVGNLVIGNLVGGDIEAAVGNLRITPNSKIAGSVNYISEEEISVADTASVSGTINRRPTPEFMTRDYDQEWEAVAGGFSLFTKLASLITTLIIGLLAIKLMPNYIKRGSDLVLSNLVETTTKGFISLVVGLIVFLVLVFTIIGIPVALIGSLFFVVFIYLSRIYGMIAIGNFISQKTNIKTNIYGFFVGGIVIYYLVSAIPVIGWLFSMLLVFASFGASVMNKKQAWDLATKAKIV